MFRSRRVAEGILCAKLQQLANEGDMAEWADGQIKARTGKFVPVEISGQKLHMLVDCGCNKTILALSEYLLIPAH